MIAIADRAKSIQNNSLIAINLMIHKNKLSLVLLADTNVIQLILY